MKSRYSTNNTMRFAMYFIAILPMLILRDFTPDNELRYLSIADEALQNGSIFTFASHGMVYADKPPLYLWIVMLGKWLLGYHSLLLLGLFSFVPALVIIAIMDNWVKELLSERERLVAQLMLITSGFFVGAAVVLRMDMLMCMFIVLALRTFFRIYSGNGRARDSIVFPIYIFLAIFTKGPIGIIVPLVSTILFLIVQKEIRTIGKYWNMKTFAILLLLCGAWFIGVYAEGGSKYLNNLLFNQTINRAVNSFHHKEPFYYYFVAFLYSLAPWSLLIVGVLIAGIKRKCASTDLERFFLTIALSTFMIFSLVSSKLAIYMLPAFPFFVYLGVVWATKLGVQQWMLWLVGIPAGILSLTFPGLIVTSLLYEFNEVGITPLVFVAGFILSGTGILSIRFLIKRSMTNSIISLATGILLSVFTVSFAIPKYNRYIGLQQICDQAKETTTKSGSVNYYYCEMPRADNMDIYLGKMPEKLRICDLYKPNSPIKTPAIIFIRQKAIERNDSLRIFIQDKVIHQLGGNYYIEIER